jgi:hypothetical protein
LVARFNYGTKVKKVGPQKYVSSIVSAVMRVCDLSNLEAALLALAVALAEHNIELNMCASGFGGIPRALGICLYFRHVGYYDPYPV